MRAFLLPGPTIARLSEAAGNRKQDGKREGYYKEAAFPAAESTRTSRGLAPDASLAAQASGFFFTCRPLENGTSRHVEHECTLVRPVVTMRLLQYTDNADFRNAVGKGGRERWIDRRVKPSLADPPPRGLGSETEMLEKKKGGERGCDKKGLRRRDYLRRMIDRLS